MVIFNFIDLLCLMIIGMKCGTLLRLIRDRSLEFFYIDLFLIIKFFFQY